MKGEERKMVWYALYNNYIILYRMSYKWTDYGNIFGKSTYYLLKLIAL